MESSLKKTASNKYDLTVELGREELSAYVKKAEERFAENIQLDGFRKGKAPKDLIRKKVGEQPILKEAMDMAVNDSLSRTVKEKELEVLKISDLKVKDNSTAKLIYSVSLTVFPLIKLTDLSGIKVKERGIEITPVEINDALDFLRTSRSKFLAKDGSADKGDRVEVDFEVTSEGLPVEGGVSKNHPLILGDNKFIPGFEDKLVGMKTGEEKDFSLNAPAEYFHKSVAGKKLDFKVKVVTVQRIERPALNDEFAKGLGRFNDLKELEENIKEGISEEKKHKEKQRVRIEILSKIFDKSKVEVPEEMVIEKLDGMIAGFDNELHAKGMELSFYLAHLGKTEDELRTNWRPDAERQVAYALILRKLAKENNLYPSQEEINEESEKAAQTMAIRGEVNPEELDIEKLKDAITGELVNERVFKYLEKNCIS